MGLGDLGMVPPDFSVSLPPPLPPPCNQELLMAHDFTKFHSLKPKLLEALDEMLTHDIAKLMPLLRQEELESTDVGVQGGAFEGTHMGPFVERGLMRPWRTERRARMMTPSGW